MTRRFADVFRNPDPAPAPAADTGANSFRSFNATIRGLQWIQDILARYRWTARNWGTSHPIRCRVVLRQKPLLIVPVNDVKRFANIPELNVQGDFLIDEEPVGNSFYLQPSGLFTLSPDPVHTVVNT